MLSDCAAHGSAGWVLALGITLTLFSACAPRSGPAADPAGERHRDVALVRRSFEHGVLELVRDTSGFGRLRRVDARGVARPVACDPLEGAWGLWVDDVDGDDWAEVLVALRKRARFDPVVENRLHVYAIAGDRCVPRWRGTRLAGRFDRLSTRHGLLYVHERIGDGRSRLAWYGWNGFGFSVRSIAWSGTGAPPGRLLEPFAEGATRP